jgi:hypothetical protein
MLKIVPISSVTMNIPGRMSMAKKEIVFKTMLPALGLNTYYFRMATKETKLKITHNEICTLENQVRN